MHSKLKLLSFATLLLGVGVACDATTPTESEPVERAAVAEAEPAVAHAEVKTPFDQAENAADIQVTAEIRRQVIAHDSLSTNADNAKIMTAAGVVTLGGQVNSLEESKTLEEIARGVAGVHQVQNQLQIAQQ